MVESSSGTTNSRSSSPSSSGSTSRSGHEPVERAAPEDPADQRRALEHALLARVEPVDPGRDQTPARCRGCGRAPRPPGACGRSPRGRAGCPPPARARAPAARAAPRPARAARRRARSLSCASSGASSIALARRMPPPQVGRVSSRSGRVTATISTGTLRSDRARCSIRSRSGSSAQCTSSKTRTSGCRSASCSAQRSAAQVSSADVCSPSAAPSTPSATASRSATASLSQREAQLLEGVVRRVVVGDPGARLDHRGERPVGHALAVGQRAPGQRRHALERVGELRDEPRLAEPRLAEDGHELHRAVPHRPLERVLEQLPAPPRGRRAARRGGAPGRARAARARSRAAPCRPLISSGPALSTSTAPAASRRAPWPSRTCPGSAACCRRTARFTASPVAKVDSASSTTTSPDSTPIRTAEPERLDLRHDLERRPQRPLRVVLVRDGHAERRHDRVAGELLDGAAVLLDRPGDLLEVAVDALRARPPDRRPRRARSSRPGRRRRPSQPCVPRTDFTGSPGQPEAWPALRRLRSPGGGRRRPVGFRAGGGGGRDRARERVVRLAVRAGPHRARARREGAAGPGARRAGDAAVEVLAAIYAASRATSRCCTPRARTCCCPSTSCTSRRAR